MWRAAVVPALLVLLASATSAQPPSISALDSFEVYADGFGDLRGIVVDDDGNALVADREAGTITRVAPDQSRAVVASGLERPIGLALDTEGRLLVAEERAGRVIRVEPGGRRTTLVSGVKQPRWLAVSGDGIVFVSARGLTRDTDPEPDDESAEPEVVLALRPNGALDVFADGFKRLQGLVVIQESLFVATQGLRDDRYEDGVVFRLPIGPDGASGAPTRLGPTNRYRKPVGLAGDRLGALFLTTQALDLEDDTSRRTVAKLTPTGVLTLYAENLDRPQGAAFDAGGNLYVADGRSGRVLRFRAPRAPTLSVPAVTNMSPLGVTGTAPPTARVDLFVDNAQTPLVVEGDGTGAFTASIVLTPNAVNVIEGFATTHGGRGLTSAPMETEVIHDGIAPALTFQAPTAAHVRGNIDVRVQATDTGSAVHAFTLAADDQTLTATTLPGLPTASAILAAGWSTPAVADGAHTLRANATDGAGNSSVASRIVVVDNTPPSTVISSGPIGATPDGTVTFTFAGTDNLTPPGALLFAWRVDGGSFTEFSASTSAILTGLSPGSRTFEVAARDLAGNVDPTPAAATFTIGGAVQVRITSPASASLVPAGSVLVQGTVAAGADDVSVAVNGVPAATQNGVFVALVPTTPGAFVLTAVGVTSGGAVAEHSVTVTVSGDAPAEDLIAVPQSGLAPLTVAFSLSRSADAVIALDADGDGTVDVTGSALDEPRFTFTRPGLYVPAATITDRAGRQTVARSVVQVYERATLDAFFKAKWAAMKSAVLANDLTTAVTHFASPQRDRYRALFTALSGDIARIVLDMQDIELIYAIERRAKYRLPRTQLWGGRLITLTYYVYFVQDGDGLWTIESF